jgi:hypothetical protein
MVAKMLSLWTKGDLMHTRVASRAIVTIQVIGRVAIVIAMGMILTVIGAGIYGMLGITH